jgi:arylsulfatase A-like enzyme
LAELARAGVLFRDVTAPDNWTWPTHASIFTGLPPWVHGAHFGQGDGAVQFAWGPAATAMRDDLPTLAERLAGAGYRTGFLTANGVVSPKLAASLLRGFETAEQVWGGDRKMIPLVHDFVGADAERPAFLFVNLAGAHAPYLSHGHEWVREYSRQLEPRTAPKWLNPFLVKGEQGITLYKNVRPGVGFWAREIIEGREALPARLVPLIQAAYDSDLAEVDAVLGELIDSWHQGSDSWVIAVTSDHGESLGEDGLAGHGFLHDTNLLVPLIIATPGGLAAGRTIRDQVRWGG